MSNHVLQYRAQADYNRWFNESVYAAAGGLTDEERREDVGAFFGSVHAMLNHILLGDRIWLGRLRDAPAGANTLADAAVVSGSYQLDAVLCDDFDMLISERRATDTAITRFADALSDEYLGGTMRYANSNGEERVHPTWVAVSHLFNHQTHHRGQVTTLLSQRGIDPGVTDFFVPAMAFLNG
jgi:uncharacterized damage-inducible protein DinB